MQKLNTAAAHNLLSRFGSRDIIASKSLIVEDISKENVACKFNLALDNIQFITPQLIAEGCLVNPYCVVH